MEQMNGEYLCKWAGDNEAPRFVSTSEELREYGKEVGQMIMSWDKQDIEDLREMIAELHEVQGALNADHGEATGYDEFGVDLSALPTEDIPPGLETYPIWAMDKDNSDCLYGEGVDSVENIKEVALESEGYEVKKHIGMAGFEEEVTLYVGEPDGVLSVTVSAKQYGRLQLHEDDGEPGTRSDLEIFKIFLEDNLMTDSSCL